LRRWPGLLAALLVLSHFHWTATSSGNPYRFGAAQSDYYNLLGDGLLAGRLSLLREPDPGLLALPDPYDPQANAAFRLPNQTHDLSLFEGRYYLYFGVAPVLTLFLPYRFAFGSGIPENFALFLFCSGCFLATWATTRLVLARAAIDLSAWRDAAIALFVGLCGFAPFVLRRPAVYEVAVAAGAFFLMLAAWLAAKALLDESVAALAASSLALGLAVAARPIHVAAVPLLLALVGSWLRDGKPRGSRVAAALVPLACCLASILAYNRARFGEWLEFGQRYILADYHHPSARLFSASYWPMNAYLLLLAPPAIGPEFPFVEMHPTWTPQLPEGYLTVEPVAGLLACVPLAALALGGPLLYARRSLSGSRRLVAAAAAALLLLGLSVFMLLAGFGAATARYLLDFAPPLLGAAALVWVLLSQTLTGWRRRAFDAVTLALLACGVLANLAVGLTGYYDWLKRRNTAVYQSLENAFAPLQRLWLSLGSRRFGDARLRLRFPAAAAGRAEALLSVNRLYRHDVLCVRYLEGGRALLRFHHRGGWPAAHSETLELPAQREATIDVAMGSLYPVNARVLDRLFPGRDARGLTSSLRVAFDGREVLAGRYDFIPSPPSDVRIGRDPVDAEHCPLPFSGEVLSVERRLPLFDP
jgi:hypothetical protein